jgi:hypothetical protein
MKRFIVEVEAPRGRARFIARGRSEGEAIQVARRYAYIALGVSGTYKTVTIQRSIVPGRRRTPRS